ncbi:MAG: alpha/beta fold hydrolase [Nitrospinota bacterium]
MPTRTIVQEDYLIDALDAGIRLHIRQKRPKGKRRFSEAETILLCHGRLAPGPVAFDLPVPGYSWMDDFAAQGFNVFTMSVRGFGSSTRPPEMDRTPAGRPPAVRGRTALRDIEAAVWFICDQNNIDRINLLGRSWSTTTTGAFAAAHRNRVRRLVLYAPYYAYDDPQRAAQLEDPAHPGKWDARRGAWGWTTLKDMQERWWGHIPGKAHHRWRDKRLVRAYWETYLKSEPNGSRRRPPGVHTPNGSLADLYDRVQNKPPYDASRVRCPVLLIFGDHDGAANQTEAWGLFQRLTASQGKRYIVIGEGTHFMEFEHRREEFLREVRNFL